ncbi:MAG: hypothetical protein M1814_004514 [Vezdaea aestivalis]|nr:MAG: hypothetical protein M1814_004514 [Vezdaea aestivalis]
MAAHAAVEDDEWENSLSGRRSEQQLFRLIGERNRETEQSTSSITAMTDIDPRLRGPSAPDPRPVGDPPHYRELPPLSMTVNPLPPALNPSSSKPDNRSSSSDQPLPHPLATTAPQPYYRLDPADSSPPDSHSGLTSAPGISDPNDPKRPRACEACRGLKVRCQPDEKQLDGPCKRCAKAGRQCIVTAPSRKRQKKTDSRVAELEKKIDALTASLQARTGAPQAPMSESEGLTPDEGESYLDEPPRTGNTGLDGDTPGTDRLSRVGSKGDKSGRSSMVVSPVETRASIVSAGSKRRHSDDSHIQRAYDRSTKTVVSVNSSLDGHKDRSSPHTAYPFLLPKGPRSRMQSSCTPDGPLNTSANTEYTDIIDRGLLTAEQANGFFNRYVHNMAPHFPAVVFQPGTTPAQIRRTKPMLFLSIVSAASGETNPELQRMLNREVLQSLAERIVVKGEKKLELIQALQVSTIWYWPPERHEELNFYQLIHMAAVMAMDIGIAKKLTKMNVRWGIWSTWRDKSKNPLPDPASIEARRAWLTCYYACQTRQNLVQWIPYNDDCIDVLETSPDALPSDKYLCQWVKLQHVMEEVGTSFSMDDPFATAPISDPKVQYALRGFERQMTDWEAQITPEASHRRSMVPIYVYHNTHQSSALLRLMKNVTNLYIHEIAMHVDHNVDDFGPPFTEETLKDRGSREPLSPAHISGLTVCMTSCHSYLDEFIALQSEIIRCVPILIFVRTMYTVVILIKLHFSAVSPKSELGKIFGKEDLKVEYYVETLVAKFRHAAEESRSRPAEKFLHLLGMMRRWFLKLNKGESPSRPASAFTCAPNGSQMGDVTGYNEGSRRIEGPPEYASANTPLHLLSEVAMGNGLSSANSPSTNKSDPRYYPSSWASSSANVQNYSTGMPMQVEGTAMAGLEGGIESIMGDGMQQAMQLSGYGDDAFGGLGSMFMDTNFMNAIMDGTTDGFQF